MDFLTNDCNHATTAVALLTNPSFFPLQIENKARMHHILERAQELKDEQLPEVRLFQANNSGSTFGG